MLSIGYPVAVTQQRLQTQVDFVKRALDEARIEAVSGRHADLFTALGGQTGRVHRVDKAIADIDQRLTQVGFIKADFSFVMTNIDAASKTAGDIGARLIAAVGANDDIAREALTTEAETEIRGLFTQLNMSFGGRQLFAGAATDTPPLADVDTMLDAVKAIVGAGPDLATINTALDDYFTGAGAGTFAEDIYQGSTADAPTREITSTRRIGVTMRADDDGLKAAYRGYAMMLAADQLDESLRDEVLNAAAEQLSSGSLSLINSQTRLGADEGAVEKAATRLTAERTAYEELLFELVNVDQYEAASRMTNLETQLEAIYLTTSRLKDLSLTNYI